MQNPIIFLATADQDLEKATFESAQKSGHEMRPAHSIHYACQILGTSAADIALAIIDVDLQQSGRSLVHILASCQHGYPIVAVAQNPETFERDASIAATAVECLAKPVSTEELVAVIERFSLRSIA